MSRSLPERPNLEQLRKQAKDLRKAHKQGNASVCRMLRHLSRFAGSSDADILKAGLSLSEAQHALAREYGFKSWAALAHGVRKGRPAAENSAFTDMTAKATIEELRPGMPYRIGGTTKCHLCDRPATVHVTDRSEGKTVERHYCIGHAARASLANEKANIPIYPVKYAATVPVTQDQIERQELIRVTLPDGSERRMKLPRDIGIMEGFAMTVGPRHGAAGGKYGVLFSFRIIRPPRH
jgi:hypothetical protein